MYRGSYERVYAVHERERVVVESTDEGHADIVGDVAENGAEIHLVAADKADKVFDRAALAFFSLKFALSAAVFAVTYDDGRLSVGLFKGGSRGGKERVVLWGLLVECRRKVTEQTVPYIIRCVL